MLHLEGDLHPSLKVLVFTVQSKSFLPITYMIHTVDWNINYNLHVLIFMKYRISYNSWLVSNKTKLKWPTKVYGVKKMLND